MSAVVVAVTIAACDNGPNEPSGNSSTVPTTSVTTSIGGPGGGSTSSVSSSVTTTSTGSSTTSTISTSTSSSTTTSTGQTADSRRYIGSVLSDGNTLPLDLSAFFNLPKGAKYTVGFAFPRAIFDVSGGYNTGSGPNGYHGEIIGQLDGTIGNGTFSGRITAFLDGCTASRNYTGPLTPAAFDFGAGSHINTCGDTPLTDDMDAPASNLPTSQPIGPRLEFTFDPSPVPTSGFTTACSGGNTPRKTWNYRLTIRNTGDRPFSLQFWGRASTEGTTDFTVNQFISIFDTTTIAPGSSVNGSLCMFFTSATSGEVRYFLRGVNNDTHGTPILILRN